MNPLEIKTSKNAEGHPGVKRRLPASAEALESIALKDSGALGMTIWSIQRSRSGHKQSSGDSPRHWREQKV